jgi:hypothetical protein
LGCATGPTRPPGAAMLLVACAALVARRGRRWGGGHPPPPHEPHPVVIPGNRTGGLPCCSRSSFPPSRGPC